MINFLIKKLALKLESYCTKNNKVYYIKGGDENATVYLVRYIVFKTKYLSLYIHRFMRSDSDDAHNHPFNFLTYIISGGYKEVFYDRMKPQVENNEFTSLWTRKVNVRHPGSWAYRKASDIHQVLVNRSYEMSEIKKAPFTLCLMGPRIQEWGFWPVFEKGAKFIDWRTYLSITPDDPRTKGSE